MHAVRLGIDPLWQCLCPYWNSLATKRVVRLAVPQRPPPPSLQCRRASGFRSSRSDAVAAYYASRALDDGRVDAVLSPLADTPPPDVRIAKKRQPEAPPAEQVDYRQESVQSMYSRLRALAVDGGVRQCRQIAEILVEEKGERANTTMYKALILSHSHPWYGSAWQVGELLDEMKDDGLQPDADVCHAVLKVLSVHVDHLLRTDILAYMSQRWIQISEDGAHDIVAGLLREGLFEQALERLEGMQGEGMHVKPWLLDMAVYVLCEANEISEAYRIMHQRFRSGEQNLSRSLWSFFLDKASAARHHAATSLVWSEQVNRDYLNPSSGACLSTLATAARSADAVMATEVFTHLSKRGTVFQPAHYELLISAYLASSPPDLKRAITILTIMALEKLEPTAVETRPLYLHLREKPNLLLEAFEILRDLHGHGRMIPVAALNVLIECHVEQGNLSEALKIYKQIHTFVPISEGAKKTFADIETFNLLLKGCRVMQPPDAEQASFLVSELLALRIKPTALTYDRLILVFAQAGRNAIGEAVSDSSDLHIRDAQRDKGHKLIDWAFRHFTDMQALKWMPRFGTMELLSVQLARLGDARCWDVLQAGEDGSENIDSWNKKGHFARRQVEEAWESSRGNASARLQGEPSEVGIEQNGSNARQLAGAAY